MQNKILDIEPKIYLDENGITIKCTPNCYVGFKGIVNGIEYEVVDRELLEERIVQNSELSNLCVSLIEDMSSLFINSGFNKSINNWDVSNVSSFTSFSAT